MKAVQHAVIRLLLGVLLGVSARAADPAPNFSLQSQDGKTIDLKKLAGKAVVVKFWATWCGACRAEIPGMLKVYEKYKGKGLEIVGISLDRGGWDDVKPYLAKNKISYPIVVAGQELTAFGSMRMFAPKARNSCETFPWISREMVRSDAAMAVPTATATTMRAIAFLWLRKDRLMIFSSIQGLEDHRNEHALLKG